MILGRIKQKLRRKKRINSLGSIGKNSEIFDTVVLGSEPYLIHIGDNVKVTDRVVFVNHDGGVHVLRNLKEEYKDIDMFGKTIIKDNVFIGINSIIMPGVTIGNNVIVGAGSLVTKSIPDNSVVAGVPAKPVSTIEEYEKRKKNNFVHTKYLGYEDKKAYTLKLDKEDPDKFLKK